jgi:hypothetical protein
MSPQAKEEYFEVLYKRYKEATRKEKTAIIDEYCVVCGYHRKRAIRCLRGYKRFTKPRAKKRGKPAVYNKDAVIRPLKQIWLTANLPCSKRLKAILPLWLPKYSEHFGQLAKFCFSKLSRCFTRSSSSMSSHSLMSSMLICKPGFSR